MATYGRKMLQASLKKPAGKNQQQKNQTKSENQPQSMQTEVKSQAQTQTECDKCKVAGWLDECPDSVSMVSTDMVSPSVSSKATGIAFPSLQTDQHQFDLDLTPDDNDSDDSDYQPSDDDDVDSDEISIQHDYEMAPSTHGESFVRKAVFRNGAQILDKHQFCYYCEKPQLKLSRHLTSIHKTEQAVAQLMAAKHRNPKIYEKGLKKLKCMGNFNHNVQSLKLNKSDIVVVKRPSKQRKISEYLPCIHCYGFYVVDELWKHTKNCDLKSSDADLKSGDADLSNVNIHNESRKLLAGSNVVQQSKLLLQSACLPDKGQFSMSDGLHTLITAMHQDELAQVVRKDKLLLLFGEILLKKYGPMRKNDIAQRMRQLARLLLKCREKISDSTLSYYSLLCGKSFETCLEGTFKLCGLKITNDGRREFQIPSLALRLGHLLRKLVTAKQGFCLRNDDIDGVKEAESFGQLLQSEWTDAIATNAHNTLKRRKDQSVDVLPLTDDLRLLRELQVKEIKRCIEQLQVQPSYSTWRKLAQLTMTRMTMFNKRRGGEVSKMLLETYTKRPDWKNLTNQEVFTSLQPLERVLLNRIDLVQIPGKKSRKVPMLITNDVKEGIEALNANRDVVGIPDTNPFCFASKSSSGHLDNWQALNLISQEASLKHPELVTSTKLRKYNATVSQLFDLNSGELEWLSNHMGHDLNIHKDFYRLHDSTIEIAKVSRLLLAIDSGNAARFMGKTLDEITLDDFGYEGIESEIGEKKRDNEIGEKKSDSQDGESMILEVSTHQSTDKSSHSSVISADLVNDAVAEKSEENGKCPGRKRKIGGTTDSDCEERGTKLKKTGQRSNRLGEKVRKRHIRKQYIDSEVSISDSEDGQKKFRKKIQKSSWSKEEIELLKVHFGHLLEQGLYPSGKQIQNVITQNHCLKKRTTLIVRSKLQNLMKKKQ